jgi:hypothetical protein
MGWLLPVGTPGGVNSGFNGLPEGYGIVRLGNEFACLEPDDYRLWRAAAAVIEAERLMAWGMSQDIADAAERVHQLEDAELLIPEGPDLAARIRGLAVRLIGECLGNGAEISPAFFVRGRGGALLQVDGFLFELLLRSDGLDPVSVMCDGLDATRSEPGYRPRIEALTEALPVLVRNEVVLLETAVR